MATVATSTTASATGSGTAAVAVPDSLSTTSSNFKLVFKFKFKLVGYFSTSSSASTSTSEVSSIDQLLMAIDGRWSMNSIDDALMKPSMAINTEGKIKIWSMEKPLIIFIDGDQ